MITVTASARCLCPGCGWIAAGTMAAVDRAADKHTRTTGHPTATIATPGRRTP
jgi:hypothetical protein